MRFEILKSSPLRLGIAFSILYLACFSIASVIHYRTLESKFLLRIDESIVERYVAIRDVYEQLGLDAVIAVAEKNNELPMQYTMGFHLASSSGQRIVGNVPTCTTDPGWLEIPGEELGLDSAELYRFYTAHLGDNVLSLGRSLKEVDELRASTLASFTRTFLVSTTLAILGAMLMAFRTHCRIDRISKSMDNVAAGNLDARLPIGSTGDDIDQLSIKMNDALDRLKGTVDGMKQVSSDIAHDLKTPLNRLYINLEEAARRRYEAGDTDESLEKALDEAENINSTFEALLRIAQIEAGARRAQFKSIDICALMHSVAEVYAPVVQEEGQTLTIDSCTAPSGVTMMGDKDLLMQMLVNLIENAIRHCGDGTNVVLSANQSGEDILISVGDNGPGIPEADREKIFRRLYRVEASRTTPGTGLGLSMVKAISDLHCGNIDVCDNKPGVRFDLRFKQVGECA